MKNLSVKTKQMLYDMKHFCSSESVRIYEQENRNKKRLEYYEYKKMARNIGVS